MKKKIYIIGVMTVLAITCFGCGKKDAATDRKVAEATTEITTETTEEVTEQSDKKKAEKTTEATEKVTEDKKSEKSDKKSDTKKSDKSKAANTATQSGKAVTQPADDNKVVSTTNNTGNTGSNTSANNTQQTITQTTPAPQTTECQHNWEAVTHTVHHDAVMGERITKSAVYAHWYCRNCQKYYLEEWDDPCNGANGSDARYCLEPAVRETYEVTPAYDETVTDYYKCSKCGARK